MVDGAGGTSGADGGPSMDGEDELGSDPEGDGIGPFGEVGDAGPGVAEGDGDVVGELGPDP